MSNLFKLIDSKTVMMLNSISIFITAICEVFAIYMLLTKGQQPDLTHWKYVAIIIGVVIISLLLIGSIISMVLFINMKRKKNSS